MSLRTLDILFMCVGGKDPGEPEGMGPQGQHPGCPQLSPYLSLQQVPEPAVGAVAPVVVNHPLVLPLKACFHTQNGSPWQLRLVADDRSGLVSLGFSSETLGCALLTSLLGEGTG